MQTQYTGLFSGFDFLSKRIFALIFFIAAIFLGSVSFIINKGFVLGTDFSGGIRIEFSSPGSIEEIRTLITEPGISITTLKTTDGTITFFLTAPANLGKDGSGDYLLDPLRKQYGKDTISILSSEFIGPSVGYDFTIQALKLLGIVALLILVYVAFRFDLLYGIGAITALFHDMIIMLICTIIFRIPVDLTILAAYLTILGYSINDTIVIFDRVRENYAAASDEDLLPIMNKSISQSLIRTLLTSVTTLFVAVSIYIWAGASLKNFGLLLIIGIISGTYSSIFVASPITYLAWKNRNTHNKMIKN